jgi:TolB-like protein
MLRGLFPGLLLLAAAGPSTPTPRGVEGPKAAEGVRYALVPPRNLSGVDGAVEGLFGRLTRALEARGAEFVPADEVDQTLRTRRIRYTDSLGPRELAGLSQATGATYTLVATIFDYTAGKEPRLSFTLRALDNRDARRALSTAIALRGVDFEGLLGLGRIEDVETLADEAVARALEQFDARGAPRGDTTGEPATSRPEPPDDGYGFAREDFDPSTVERLGVLPFANRSGNIDAPTQFVEFLGDAWFHEAGIQVAEVAELRAALVVRKVRSMQFVDLTRLAEIGQTMGVRYFVLGAIERWGDEVLVDDQRFPEIEATMQLVDTQTGRIVAAASLARRGSDYQTVLGLGAIRDPAELARRAAREIVIALGG